jgi:isopropylmalate/homocitrate/citramalate synthase
MLSNSYPKCIHSLNKWLQQKGTRGKRQDLYNKLNPQLFDVTLRDGLQTVPKEMEHLWTTQEKKTMYYRIKFNHCPKYIEIGSLANPKLMPIFADSLELHNSIKDDLNLTPIGNNNLFLLTPSLNAIKGVIDKKVDNFSFITSVSNAFQKKNTNKTLLETKKEIQLMCDEVQRYNNDNSADKKVKTKLYISCINDCPLTGQIDNDYIVREILLYEKNQMIGELCLSDTCGTLKFEDFEYIIDNCLYFGLPAKKLSLHLHYSAKNLENTKQIIHYAFDKNINKFDVSMIEGGGCSMTMSQEKCTNNLSYELFYKFLVDYIVKRIE